MKLRSFYVVHGTLDCMPSSADLLGSIRPPVPGLELEFQNPGDMLGSFGPAAAAAAQSLKTLNEEWGYFRLTGAAAWAISMRRVRRGETAFHWNDDKWEAGLRTLGGPYCEDVIQHLRNTCQSINLMPVPWFPKKLFATRSTLGPSRLARVCEQLCGHLARATDGMIQVFQEGFFTADGESLLPHAPQHRLKTK